MTNQVRRRFGARLREERERLALTQERFAQLAGVRRVTQHMYESGERVPNIEYLDALKKSGCDIVYLATGDRTGGHLGRSGTGLTKEQLAVIYRLVDAFANDRHGRPLSADAREKLFLAACDILMSDGQNAAGAQLIEQIGALAKAYK